MQDYVNLEIIQKRGSSINPFIHHSKVFSSELGTVYNFNFQMPTVDILSIFRPWISFPFSDLRYPFLIPTLDILSRIRPWISFPDSDLGYPFQIPSNESSLIKWRAQIKISRFLFGWILYTPFNTLFGY